MSFGTSRGDCVRGEDRWPLRFWYLVPVRCRWRTLGGQSGGREGLTQYALRVDEVGALLGLRRKAHDEANKVSVQERNARLRSGREGA